MLRHAFRLTGNADAAQDIWQESAMSASKGITRLRDAAKFHAWIYRITTLKCRDWQRKSYSHRESLHQFQDQQVHNHDAGSNDSSKDEVRAILDQLRGEDKALLSLYYIEGFSVREISNILDLGSSAVKTRLFRARNHFREHWEGDKP